MTSFKSIDFVEGNLILIDQTKLPLEELYITTDNYQRIAAAIEKLEVRGAPAIGVTAAYALALSFKHLKSDDPDAHFEKVYKRLASTRPTAVNLFWALKKMMNKFKELNNQDNIYSELLEVAKKIHEDDILMCDNIARNGLEIFERESVVLTHCNTGQLATGGGGTAFYIIKRGFEKGLVKFVHADETRPLLQGSRLTAFELEKAGIPFSINTDSTAAVLMSQGRIDLVITGADRIASNGDSANKIGTYNLAILCKYFNIPFYIAAPTSTIDLQCVTGDDIKIEEREGKEITALNGRPVTRDSYEVYAPAFDVTPANLISGIITEKALHKPPYDFNG